MTLSNDHLTELTELVNARLQEFGLADMPKLTPGVTRVVVDVIKQWYQEKEEPWAMQRISEVTITAAAAMKLSKQGYETGYAARDRELLPVREDAEDKRHFAELERIEADAEQDAAND